MKNILMLWLMVAAIYSDAQNVHPSVKTKPDTIHKGWVYDKPDTDKFTTDITNQAHLISNDKKVRMIIESLQGMNIVGFIFNKAVKKNTHDTAVVLLKFDNNRPEYYAFIFPYKDNESILREYAAANQLIVKLKTTKQLEMSVTFTDGDSQRYIFAVAGLKWNHLGKEKPEKEIVH